MATLKEQIDQGHLKAVGGSNFSTEQLVVANRAGTTPGVRLDAVQNIYNLATASQQDHIFDLCRNEQISFSPLGTGVLTGKYTPSRHDLPAGLRFAITPAHCDIYFSERNPHVVEQLRAKAEQRKDTLAHLAATWVTSSPEVSCVRFGARTTLHIDSTLRAYHALLSTTDRNELQSWGTD